MSIGSAIDCITYLTIQSEKAKKFASKSQLQAGVNFNLDSIVVHPSL